MMACKCGKREAWRVVVRNGNYSAFSGYRFTPSEYSLIRCVPERGGCGAYWRTKAKYVGELADAREQERYSAPSWMDERPTADTDPGECRWCHEEASGGRECPYHGEAAQRSARM